MSNVARRAMQSRCAQFAHGAQVGGASVAMAAALTVSSSAQTPDVTDAVITDNGSAAMTYVLVSGTIGGVSGFKQGLHSPARERRQGCDHRPARPLDELH